MLGKDGAIERIVVPERLEAHRLIEEFMIQANVAAAETLEAKKSPLVYRIHDAPSLAKLEALREFLASIELSLPKSGNLRPSHFNRILDAGRRIASTAASSTRSCCARQAQAEYSPENIGHFGLNLRRYAHFTSPIRRYADLIVHRALIRALKLGAGGLPDGIGERAAGDRGADLGRRAPRHGGRARHHRPAGRPLARRPHRRDLPRPHLRRHPRRPVRQARRDRRRRLRADVARSAPTISSMTRRRHALIGQRTGEMHRLGDQVEVRLVEAAPLAGALRFELLSEGRILPALRTSPRRAPCPRTPWHEAGGTAVVRRAE